jgi:phage tail protein X
MKAIAHRTGAFERWDTLAWKYYGDPLAYGKIIEANPALDIGAVLPSGVVVLIPVLPLAEVTQTLAAKDLPPWKR